MDKIKYGETIVLEDGKEYSCFANIDYQDKDYIFLISDQNSLEIKFAEQKLIDGEFQIQFVTSKELKHQLLKKFEEKHGKNFLGIK